MPELAKRYFAELHRLLEKEDLLKKACHTSTVTGAAILKAVVAATIEELLGMGVDPPVLVSSNV
jgi:uncharacterized phosphosugar-binding protein